MKKVTLSAKILAAATVGFSVITLAPAANAASLVPNIEGEVKLLNNGACLTNAANCIDTSLLGYTIESLDYKDGFGKSLLFADDRNTANTYTQGSFEIKFLAEDEGTNPALHQNWFRPVAVDENGKPLENGRLEVGLFEFVFDKVVNGLNLSFFDVETSGFSGVIKVNGIAVNNLLPGGPDSNLQYITLDDVKTLQIQLGQPGVFPSVRTGDGVSLAVSVPEPGTIVSLGALAVAGMFGVRKGKKVSQVG
ncbi:LEVG family PEP-CTERM protein [Calothrix sp. UHCC 0171]|uniref:LEVG family PEP-CTERM protein n=1 Tax=Calothrix sp. UHCC 0171 TaxID=3110245 RepID=UPI002B21CBC5|nr:LEVG family PEP-CTERM protein [Calothrix sp. UHCC 0171]MEA5571300.1 LEVG family PEP-CTERM protein [Calothrix sp. UHCC 0171]